MGGRVDTAGKTADYSETGPCELEAELAGLFAAIMGHAAGTDHADGGGVAGFDLSLHIEKKRGIVNLPQGRGIVAVFKGDGGDPVIGHAALLLCEVDQILPTANGTGHLAADSRDLLEVFLTGADDILRLGEGFEKTACPDRADAR